MKVDIFKVKNKKDEKAMIYTTSLTDEVRDAASLLENQSKSIAVMDGEETYLCPLNKIYYIEAVDKRIFLYTKDGCYEVRKRLYELEEILSADFFRCSKSMIIHMRKISSVKADFNGRMRASLLNGEEILISRGYVKNLKEKLGL